MQLSGRMQSEYRRSGISDAVMSAPSSRMTLVPSHSLLLSSLGTSSSLSGMLLLIMELHRIHNEGNAFIMQCPSESTVLKDGQGVSDPRLISAISSPPPAIPSSRFTFTLRHVFVHPYLPPLSSSSSSPSMIARGRCACAIAALRGQLLCA